MLTRALVVLLLILNLGVALWWATRDDVAPPPVEIALDAPERLRLLSEPGPEPAPDAPQMEPDAVPAALDESIDAGSAAAPADAAPAPVAAEAPPACHAIGPYADRAAAVQAVAALQPQVLRLALRESRNAPRGWRVQLRGLPDRETATATTARLAAAGFTDHYLMPAGEDGRIEIALGRFGSEAAAQRHQATLRAAGFAAVAEPIGDSAAQHWVDVVAGPEVLADALRRSAGARQAERIDCAAVAG